MKILTQEKIENAVFEIASKMCFEIDESVHSALKCAYQNETGYCKDALFDILQNVQVAKENHIPVCQDTGIVIAFCEVGSKVIIEGDFEKAINDGIRRAYSAEFLRKSVVKSPIDRLNTNDNTPAIIHTTITNGDYLKITLCPKGAGSENMGRLKMLSPADGVEGIVEFVVDTVKHAGGKACPPIIVGVGVGGDMEMSAILSKRALLRPCNDLSSDEKIAKLEKDILDKINSLGIGAMGLKGKTLALSVKIETYPCHIASLPVAVSIMCHASRHKEIVL